MMSVQASAMFSAFLAGVIVSAEHFAAPFLRLVVCWARRVLTVAVCVERAFLTRLEIHMFTPSFALRTSLDSGKRFWAKFIVLPLTQSASAAIIAALLGSVCAFLRAVSFVRAWGCSELLPTFCAGDNLGGPLAHGGTKATLTFGVHAGRNRKGLSAAFTDLFNTLALRNGAGLVAAFFRAAFTASILETIGGNLKLLVADRACDRCHFHECII